jgi:hypothetical protein
MDRKDFQYLEMFTRVVEFGEAHVDIFPKNALGGKTFAALGAALSKVSESAGGQVASRNAVRARTKARDAAHEALRTQLQRMIDTARVIAIDTPGIEGQFKMPTRTRSQALILGARALAEAAEPLKKEFAQHGLPIDDLNRAAAELESALQEQASSRTIRVSTSKALDDNLAECLKLLKRLDAIVKNTLEEGAPVMAEWTTTRRLRRFSPRSPDPEPDPSPEPSPEPKPVQA